MQSVLVDRVLPAWVKAGYRRGRIRGYWGVGLKDCALFNCYYDADRNGVLNREIYRYKDKLDYVDYNVAKVELIPTRNYGLLRKNDEIIPRDNGELGILSWDWNGINTIRIYNGKFEYMDEWMFDYEVKTAIETGIIDVGVLSSEYDVVVDGLVNYGLTGITNIREITEAVVFDANGIGVLKNKALINKPVVVVDIKTGKLLKGSFVDVYSVKIDGNIDTGYVTYYTEYLVLDRIYRLWWRGSNSLKNIGEWVEVKFLDIVPRRRYNQLKLELYGEKEEGFYMVKGLYLRLLDKLEV